MRRTPVSSNEIGHWTLLGDPIHLIWKKYLKKCPLEKCVSANSRKSVFRKVTIQIAILLFQQNPQLFLKK